jgi:sulfide dehydrogenase [flavocytochrome c] flavoprotein subunit
MIDDMDDGNIIITKPAGKYRCPPAPYERASQIAQFISEHKNNATITIIDPKSGFAKKDSFEESWRNLYRYETAEAILDLKKATVVTSIDPDYSENQTNITTSDGEIITADVVTYIPNMKASKFALDNNLNQDESKWCNIRHETFQSEEHDNVYIIGDSANSGLPKSGYVANSSAKICATHILAKIKNINMPTSIVTNGCYSFVGKEYAISIFHKYRLNEAKSRYDLVEQSRRTSPLDKTLISKNLDIAQWRKSEVSQGHSWYTNFRKDSFGV